MRDGVRLREGEVAAQRPLPHQRGQHSHEPARAGLALIPHRLPGCHRNTLLAGGNRGQPDRPPVLAAAPRQPQSAPWRRLATPLGLDATGADFVGNLAAWVESETIFGTRRSIASRLRLVCRRCYGSVRLLGLTPTVGQRPQKLPVPFSSLDHRWEIWSASGSLVDQLVEKITVGHCTLLQPCVNGRCGAPGILRSTLQGEPSTRR
jgi:hypothetical protein